MMRGPATETVQRLSVIRTPRPLPWYKRVMSRLVRRIAGARRDHLLLVAGAALLAVGAVMPWLRGATRRSGTIDWTGISDTGEGAMLIAAAILIVVFVRWRGVLEEIEPRTRWIPVGTGIVALLLLVIAFQKALMLSWWEIAPGARPQIGFLVCFVGVAMILVGGWAAARRRANEDVAAAARRREVSRRPPSAFDRDARVGSDGYAVRKRVDPSGDDRT
jgi:hypothetical protein